MCRLGGGLHLSGRMQCTPLRRVSLAKVELLLGLSEHTILRQARHRPWFLLSRTAHRAPSSPSERERRRPGLSPMRAIPGERVRFLHFKPYPREMPPETVRFLHFKPYPREMPPETVRFLHFKSYPGRYRN